MTLFPTNSYIHTLAYLGFGPFFLSVAIFQALAGRGRLYWPKQAIWIVIYLTWMSVSVIWSQSDSRLFAAGSLFAMTAEVLCGMIYCSMDTGFYTAIRGVIAGACALASFLAFQLIINPDIAAVSHMQDTAEGGVIPNYYAYRIGFGVISVLFLTMQGRKRLLPLLLCLSAALIATTNKTCIVVYLLIAFCYLTFHKTRASLKIWGILTVSFGAALALPLSLGYLQSYLSGRAAGSLTGRIPLWITAASRIAERPIIGYGFDSFKDVVPSIWQAQHAHNDLLQQWVTLGLPGILIMTVLHIVVWKRLRRSPSPFAALGLMWIIFALGHGLVESDVFYCGLPLQTLFLFLMPLPRPVLDRDTVSYEEDRSCCWRPAGAD